MSGGRSYFAKKDQCWYERGAVRRAKKEFGPTGPCVMDWLELAAKRQMSGGRVKADPFTIAEDIGSDEVTVCHVVSHLVQKKWLLSYEADGDLFKATVAWFKADQQRGDDAERKAESRAKQADSESKSRSVPVSPLREEESREEIGGTDVPPGGLASIVADLFAYWQAATGHPQAKLTKDRRAKIEARLREGYTAEQIRKAIDGAARAAFVNDSGKRFDDIELICRSGSKLESFIDRANDDGRPPAGSVSRIGPRPQRPSAGDLIDEIRANVGAA